MREESVIHVLEEERGGIEGVERDAIGTVLLLAMGPWRVNGTDDTRTGERGGTWDAQLYKVELLLLGHDVFDVGLEQRVCVEHFLADGALDGGLDLRLCAGGDAARISLVLRRRKLTGKTHSFLNMVAVLCFAGEVGVLGGESRVEGCASREGHVWRGSSM